MQRGPRGRPWCSGPLGQDGSVAVGSGRAKKVAAIRAWSSARAAFSEGRGVVRSAPGRGRLPFDKPQAGLLPRGDCEKRGQKGQHSSGPMVAVPELS